MIRSIACLLSIISLTFSIDNNGDSTVMEGVRAFYNYEFDRATNILDDARLKYPDHPGVHFIWSSSKYYISQAKDPIEATYDTLENTLDLIEPLYERYVKDYPSNSQYNLYLGSTKGLRARASLGNKEWLSILIDSYRGFTIIDKVSRENPDLLDAKLPIGIVEYYASVGNVFVRWAVDIYGLDTSKDKALKKISDAAKNSKWAWIEASGIISFIYLWLEDAPDMALPYAERLSKEFPENFYFNILHLESLIRTSYFKEANDLIRVLEHKFDLLTKRQKEWYGPYLNYEKALLLFYEKNYWETHPIIDIAIENYSGELDIILGNLFLLKGKVFDLQGDRRNAIEYYKKCIVLNNLSSAIKESKQYLKKPFTDYGL